MRIVEIEITVFEKAHAELVGENDHSTDVNRRCLIDLDRIESAWEDPPEQGGDGILLKFYSGDSMWTKTFTLDQFKKIWGKSFIASLELSNGKN